MIRSARLAAAALLLASFAPPAQADEFDIDTAVAVCAGCHGEDGKPVDPAYPIIWGQQYFYIYTQLRDYAAGRRKHELMTDIASQFDRAQAKKLAEYFAAKAWPAIPSETQPGDADLAEKTIVSGQCTACHNQWQGDSRIPRVAGQQQAYLQTTMLDLKTDRRANAADMSNTMRGIADPAIEALSRYLSAL